MEEEFLEYLVCASEKLLLEYGRTADESDAKKLRDLVMVRLRAQYLNDLRRMPYCASLKICDLSCNFLTNIDALEYCINLIKLDLHSNQLEVLPGPVFWGNMKNLKLLYLHDNGISTLENVHSLSFCPNLIALTLFNTPLCLKIAYRHIVVNSIFSLKALDYYVISDEEITEGWRLPEKYKPFTLDFFVDFCPLSGKDTTFQEEMKTVRNIISKINQVLVHHSPILIIQRWIRGHLIRKTLCLSPVCEVLRYNRYIRGGKKQHVASMSSSVSDSVKLEQHTKLKKGTPGIQIIDMNNLKEFHLTLRRLKHPVISTILKLEEKKKIKQKKSRSTGKDFIEGEKTEMESKEMATTFRLSGSKMPFYSLNEQLKIYEERQKDFFDIAHDMRNITYPIPQTLPMHDPGSIERRVFAKAYGTVRLHPLHAIEKAYWESQKLDLQAKKERDVMRMLIAKSEAKEYIRQLHEGKIEHIQKNYEEKKMKIADHFKESKKRKSKLFIKMKKKYNKFLEKKEGKTIENSFIQRFSTQHTSLTRGLLKLDGWRKSLEDQNEKKKVFQEIVQEQKQRKEVYKHFQEERQHMLQRQNMHEKTFRKYVTRVMARERFEQSKAKLKATKEPCMKELYTLPLIGSSGTAVPIAEYDG
ncbi:leucine-rich repeat and IQ domain-containing protein 3 [Python bivittatus]|uniref:Leucine-rich repeat and IQ domain-containing protein 3 n=1 Tax=Python bivittatus TaxID=176946 RepID=A0A9F5IL40_PYTBI|nr:leucine-rich repeat and IQ domain-containing protein 3 [Python bivittatus]